LIELGFLKTQARCWKRGESMTIIKIVGRSNYIPDKKALLISS
jgi:hypothetical protein